jgi:hypothetical protein
MNTIELNKNSPHNKPKSDEAPLLADQSGSSTPTKLNINIIKTNNATNNSPTKLLNGTNGALKPTQNIKPTNNTSSQPATANKLFNKASTNSSSPQSPIKSVLARPSQTQTKSFTVKQVITTNTSSNTNTTINKKIIGTNGTNGSVSLDKTGIVNTSSGKINGSNSSNKSDMLNSIQATMKALNEKSSHLPSANGNANGMKIVKIPKLTNQQSGSKASLNSPSKLAGSPVKSASNEQIDKAKSSLEGNSIKKKMPMSSAANLNNKNATNGNSLGVGKSLNTDNKKLQSTSNVNKKKDADEENISSQSKKSTPRFNLFGV